MDISQYKGIIEKFYKKIEEITEKDASIRIADDKWTLKEMIGHLIDSASNNHQRFTRLQITNELEFPGYDAEIWVQIEKWNKMLWNEIVSLWRTYNYFIIMIIEEIDNIALKNVWKRDDGIFTLEFLINDYYEHLLRHQELFEKRVLEICQGGNHSGK